MNIELNWRRRAIIILAGSLVLLSLALAILAIRDAERGRLLAERAIEEEQRRLADNVAGQAEAALSETERIVVGFLQRYREDLDEESFDEVSKRILESEELIRETFLVNGEGRVAFGGTKPLFSLPGEEIQSREVPAELLNTGLWIQAENAELQRQKYEEAIASYQKLMAETSDQGAKAFILTRIARCHVKSRNFPRAIEAYKKALQTCPPHVTAEGIPLAVIAWSQIGNVYLKYGNKAKAAEAFLELRQGLLNSKWSLTESQFGFYAKYTKTRIKALIDELDAAGKGDDLRLRWDELNRLEDERLKLTRVLENVGARVVPRLDAKRTENRSGSGKFVRISESADDAISLVSCVRLDEHSIFGMILNPEALAQMLLAPDPAKTRAHEGWYLQVTDESGKIVAGTDVSALQPSPPQLTFTATFAQGFPPWKINIYQTDLDAPRRQYQLRMGIYVFSVFTVIAALFLGGFMAIRSTAKELKLAALKSDFVSTVSHEFRTPLMSIRYLAELLQRGRVPDEQKKQQYYATITNESERLSRLVENILDFSKIETGMKSYQMEEVDIAALASEVAMRFRRQAGLKEFQLKTQIAEGLPGIVADGEALSRALFNLLDNAVKYSGDDPEVVLRVRGDGNIICLEVTDNGIGISPREQQKVFERFYRSEQVLAGKIEGSGIGLTLVDHIVKAHGGKVLLESELGRGTKVTIQLPMRLPANDEGKKDG